MVLTLQETARTPLFGPYYLAFDILRANGGDIALVTAPSPTNLIEAMLDGSADFSFGGVTRAAKEFDTDPARDLVCFGQAVGRDPSFIAGREAGAFSFEQLRGKRVGVFDRFRPSHMFFRQDLAQAGIAEGDIEMVPVKSDAAAAAALAAGELDFSQANSALAPDGNLPWNIVSSRAERGPTCYTSLFALRDRQKALRNEMWAFVRALAEAQGRLSGATAEQAAEWLAGHFVAMDRAKLVAQIDVFKRYGIWSTSPVLDPVSYQAVADAMESNGYVGSVRPFADAVSNL